MSDALSRLRAALSDRYRIEGQIGEGGMATVYLAEDVRHARKVALKVLRPELAAVVGSERFLAEIRTTANLQHPHILPLHDSGEADGFLYFVMPYIAGESLREYLDRVNQLAVEEAVRIAEKVASALEHAHGQGIVHRDIKPGNILLSTDGEPLVADFGIALAVAQAGGARVTETGLSLGTPHYMSPEQAAGDRNVDPRTDVYSLGCVLYEMLAGDPPYQASTAQAVLAKILTDPAPTLRSVRNSVPVHVDAAVRCALEKIPADRFAHASELAHALRDSGFRHGEEGDASGTPTTRSRVVRAANAAAIGGLAALSLWLWLGSGSPASDPQLLSRTSIPYPEGLVVQLPFASFPFDLSEDGNRLAFVGVEEGQPLLYVRDLDADEAVPLSGTEGARDPFFSPGPGDWIGFFAEGELRRVSADGRTVQTITRVERPTVGASWGPDGSIVYAVPPDSLFGVDAEGGIPMLLDVRIESDGEDPLAGSTGGLSYPDHLPGSRHLLARGSDAVMLVDLETRTARRVLDRGTRPTFVAGKLVVTVTGQISAVPFDLDRLQVTGTAVTAVETPRRVPGAPVVLARFDRHGNMAYIDGRLERSLVLVDRSGREDRVLTRERRGYRAPNVSPDGSEILVSVQPTPDEIWAIDMARGLSEPLMVSDVHSIMPVWDPGGRRFALNRGGEVLLVDRSTLATGPPIRRTGPIFPISFHGDHLFLNAVPPGASTSQTDIHWVDLSVDSMARPLIEGPTRDENPQISPDGRTLAFTSDRSGTDEVYVVSWPDMRNLGRVSRGGGREALWARDGTELFFLSGNRIMAVDATRGFPAPDPVELFRGDWDLVPSNNWDVTPDGKFVFVRGPPGSMREFKYVANWASQFR